MCKVTSSHYVAEEEGLWRRPCFKRHLVVSCLLVTLFIIISLLVICLYGVHDFQVKKREIMAIKQRELELAAILAEEDKRATHKRVEAQLTENYENGRRVLSNMDAIRRENRDV